MERLKSAISQGAIVQQQVPELSCEELLKLGESKILEISQYYKLLQSSKAELFQNRPPKIMQYMGIYKESPPKKRSNKLNSEDCDKWRNSGGLQGSVDFQVNSGHPVIRRRYGRVIRSGEITLRFLKFSLLEHEIIDDSGKIGCIESKSQYLYHVVGPAKVIGDSKSKSFVDSSVNEQNIEREEGLCNASHDEDRYHVVGPAKVLGDNKSKGFVDFSAKRKIIKREEIGDASHDEDTCHVVGQEKVIGVGSSKGFVDSGVNKQIIKREEELGHASHDDRYEDFNRSRKNSKNIETAEEEYSSHGSDLEYKELQPNPMNSDSPSTIPHFFVIDPVPDNLPQHVEVLHSTDFDSLGDIDNHSENFQNPGNADTLDDFQNLESFVDTPGLTEQEQNTDCSAILSSKSRTTTDPALLLRATSRDQKETVYVEFDINNEEVGKLVSGPNGLSLRSNTGDFAESHLMNQEEISTIREGSIVAVHNNSCSLNYHNADMYGVVSKRAIVQGSTPAKNSKSSYVTIAYSGRVPILIRGSICAGQRVTPCDDGTGIGRAVASHDVLDVPVVGTSLHNHIVYNGDILQSVECAVVPPPLTVNYTPYKFDESKTRLSLGKASQTTRTDERRHISLVIVWLAITIFIAAIVGTLASLYMFVLFPNNESSCHNQEKNSGSPCDSHVFDEIYKMQMYSEDNTMPLYENVRTNLTLDENSACFGLCGSCPSQMGQGNACDLDVVWAMGFGIYEHPEWYPGLNWTSSYYAFQLLLNVNPYSNCYQLCES